MPLLEPSHAGLSSTGNPGNAGSGVNDRQRLVTLAQHDAPRHCDADGMHQPFGTILVERDGTGERIGAGIGDVQHLQDGGHARLARAADALALGEIEDEIGRVAQQACQHLPAVAELLNLMPQASEHRGNGLDGHGTVELFLKVVG